MGYIRVVYWDNGKENGNCHSLLGGPSKGWIRVYGLGITWILPLPYKGSQICSACTWACCRTKGAFWIVVIAIGGGKVELEAM